MSVVKIPYVQFREAVFCYSDGQFLNYNFACTTLVAVFLVSIQYANTHPRWTRLTVAIENSKYRC